MKTEIIRLRNVQAETTPWLHSVSFYLLQGEIVGITGLNDSSYLKIADVLSGDSCINSGDIFQSAQGKQLAVIHLDSPYWSLISVAEYICVMKEHKHGEKLVHYYANSKTTSQMLEVVQADFTSVVQLGELKNYQWIMVRILREIYLGNKVILLNNVFLKLTSEEKEILTGWLQKLNTHFECSFIIICGNLGDLMELCSRVYLISNGYTVYCFDDMHNSEMQLRLIKSKRDEIRKEILPAGSCKTLFDIIGKTERNSDRIRLAIKENNITGIHYMNSPACDGLGASICGLDDTHWYQCCFSCHELTQEQIAYFPSNPDDLFLSNFSLKENFMMDIGKRAGYFNGKAISRKFENYILQDFFYKLEGLGCPAKQFKGVHYSDLTYEQKVAAAFYKLALKGPRLLVMDNVQFLQEFYLLKLISEIIYNMFHSGISFVILSKDVKDIMCFCTESYIFIHNKYMGKIKYNQGYYTDFQQFHKTN